MTTMANRAKTVSAVKAPAAKKAAPKKATAAKASAPRPRKASPKLAPAAAAPPPPPAGWYPDPTGQPGLRRYWDNAGWLGAAIPENLIPDGQPLLPAAGLPPSAGAAPAATAEGGITTTVVWFARELAVQFPDEGQIVVWRRVAKRFDGLTRDQLIAMGDEKIGRMLDQGVSVIFSILVNDADKDWIEDGLLEKKWTLAEASEIIPLALAAVNEKSQGIRESAAGLDGGPSRAARRNTSRAKTR